MVLLTHLSSYFKTQLRKNYQKKEGESYNIGFVQTQVNIAYDKYWTLQ